jgi:predicted Ser/Thr protein kinase
MPQVLKCPNPKCQKPVSVPDGAAGKQLKCPTCKVPFTVPGAAIKPAGGAPQPVAVGAAAGAAAAGGKGGGDASSMDFALPSIPQTAGGAGATKCPACGSDLLPGAISCMDCGFMLQQEPPDTEGGAAPVICTNPACGVANPPGERVCQRCSSPLPTAAGTMINNRYRIEKQLAVGGFGAVYLATDTKSSAAVAIKDMLCEDPGEFAIRLNFFRREAEILRMLEPIPIVPRLFDLIEQGQQAYLAMEFIKGKDLLKIMEAANNKPYPIEQVIEWGKRICDVLAHMHTQQPPLVHRDLKPDNIMLLEDMKTIKMIDFGTARDIGRTAKEQAKGKTRVYTEGYAPPEQIIGKPEPRSDLFALAGTLFHLATGKAPEGTFTGREIEEELKKPNCSYPAQHKWFYELIKINLAEDINDRYFSAKDIKVDLERKAVSKEQKCPKCQAPNEIRKPYCQKCAAPLTDVIVLCTQCGKDNRMGCRFCIHCGNRLQR